MAGALQLKTDLADAVSASDIIWVTCGTPVDDDDCAHVDYVEQHIARFSPASGRES